VGIFKTYIEHNSRKCQVRLVGLVTTTGTKEWAEYNINFSKGCSNNCKYCYARKMGARFGWKVFWEKMENKEYMATKRFNKRNGTIMSPSSHDITDQNIELAINVFKHILEVGNNLLIVSKPKEALIRKICENIAQWKDHVLFRFTIGTLNDSVRKYWEPGAPSIEDRINSLKYAFKNGWKTSVSIEPYLDYNVISLIEHLEPFVTDSLWVGPMNKIHVPKELWTDEVDELYSIESRLKIRADIIKLNLKKIKFKDHFLNNLD